MKIKRIGIFAVLTLGALAQGTSSVSAMQYKGNAVYQATVNGVQSIYVDGTIGSKVVVDLGLATKTSSKVAGTCGEVKISPPASNPTFNGLTVDGTAIDVSTLPVVAATCTNGAFSPPQTANFKTAKGQVIIVGKTPNTSVSIALPVEQKKNVTVNGCGFGVVHQPKGGSFPATVSINNTSYTVASIPDSGNPPVCKKTTSGYEAYTPASWSTP